MEGHLHLTRVLVRQEPVVMFQFQQDKDSLGVALQFMVVLHGLELDNLIYN